MCFRMLLCFAAGLVCFVSCSQYRRVELVRSGGVRMMLSLPEDEGEEDVSALDEVIDEGGEALSEGVYVMNAVKNEETGEMVAADVLMPSSVIARFSNAAERSGFVTLDFDINVPSGMVDSKWRLKLYPIMVAQDDSVELEPLIITGSRYREGQLRGYERYRRFIASIVTDTTDLVKVRQLELFLMRYFPETYRMKNDSTIVSDPLAATLFGATQQDALKHYTKHVRKRINDRRILKRDEMFRRFVRDPILKEGVRMDTVMDSVNGELHYRYRHTFKSTPGLKKVVIAIKGYLYAEGRIVASVPSPENMTFYISSLTSLVDEMPKYRSVIIERRAYENTKAYIDFAAGSAVLDTVAGCNASELKRIRKCIDAIAGKKDYVLDSLLIMASCSPEGAWNYNKMLAMKRSESILEYVKGYIPESMHGSLRAAQIPENWKMLKELVMLDTLLTGLERHKTISIIDSGSDPDRTERSLSRQPWYAYLRRSIYPRLRNVSFDFYMHRTGMVKDTVHTTELDSLYMEGVRALKNLDYQRAADILGPYRDYNSALASIAAERNYSALDILDEMDISDPRVCYLKAVVFARLGKRDKALKFYKLATKADQSLMHRAALDPELSSVMNFNDY